MAVNDAGQVDYRSVISSLNWRQHPVCPPVGATTVTVGGPATRAPASASGLTPAWQGNEAGSQQLVQVVRVDALMQDLA